MFYKLLEDGTVSYGQFVQSVDYELISDFHNDYTYPIDGWYWFDNVTDAESYFGIAIG